MLLKKILRDYKNYGLTINSNKILIKANSETFDLSDGIKSINYYNNFNTEIININLKNNKTLNILSNKNIEKPEFTLKETVLSKNNYLIADESGIEFNIEFDKNKTSLTNLSNQFL